MARVLSKLPQQIGKPYLYPWDEWTDGRVWELTQGEDFQCALPSFRQIVYKTAHVQGLVVQVIRVSDTSVAIQFSEEA